MRLRRVFTKLLVVLLGTLILVEFTTATLIPFQSCAESDATLNVTQVDAYFEQSSSTLNFTITGYSSTKIFGLRPENNGNSIAATAFTTASVLNTKLVYDKESLCNIVQGSCPFGPGLVSIKKSLKLPRDIPLSTLTTNWRGLDENIRQITCITFDISPQYRYYNPVFTYIPVSITIFTFFTNLLAAFFNPSKMTTDIFAITSNYGLDSHDYRLKTPSLLDVLFYTQFVVSTAELGLNYPGYYQPFISHFGWANLAFNHSTIVDFSNGNKPYIDPDSGTIISYSNDTQSPRSKRSPMELPHENPFNVKRQATQCSTSSECGGAGQCCNSGACGPCIDTVTVTNSNDVVTVTSTHTTTPTASTTGGVTTYPPSNNYVPGNITVLPENASLILDEFKGMGNYAVMVGIQPENLFLETFIIALLIIISAAATSAILWGIWEIIKYINPSRYRGETSKGLYFLLGNILRFFLLLYFPILSTAFYQLVIRGYDPWYVIAVSVIFVIIPCFAVPVALAVYIYRVSPPNLLFKEMRLRLMYGPLYNTLKEDGMRFFIVFLIYNFLRGLVVGAAQSSGIAQAVVLCVMEMFLLIMMIARFPFFENSGLNSLNIFLGVIRTLISGFLLLFIDSLGVSDVNKEIFGYIIIFLLGVAYTAFVLLDIKNLMELSFKWCGVFEDKDDGGADSRRYGMGQLKERMGFRDTSYSSRDSGVGPDKKGRYSGGSVTKAFQNFPRSNNYDTGYDDDLENYTDESGMETPTGPTFIDHYIDEKGHYTRPGRTSAIRNKQRSRIPGGQGSVGSSIGFEDGYQSDANIVGYDSVSYDVGTIPPNTAPSSSLPQQRGGPEYTRASRHLQQGNNNIGMGHSSSDELLVTEQHPRHESAGSGVLGGPRLVVDTSGVPFRQSGGSSGGGSTGGGSVPSIQRFYGSNENSIGSAAGGAFGSTFKALEDPLEVGRRSKRATGEPSEESSSNGEASEPKGFLTNVKKLFSGGIGIKKNNKGKSSGGPFLVKRNATPTDTELEHAVLASQGRGKLVVINPDPAEGSDYGDSVVDLATAINANQDQTTSNAAEGGGGGRVYSVFEDSDKSNPSDHESTVEASNNTEAQEFGGYPTASTSRHQPTTSPYHQQPTITPSHHQQTTSQSHHEPTTSPYRQQPTMTPSHHQQITSPPHHQQPTTLPSHHQQPTTSSPHHQQPTMPPAAQLAPDDNNDSEHGTISLILRQMREAVREAEDQ